MDFEEFEKPDDFSRERVTVFFQKLFYDRNYLKNVAQALRDDEVKYRRQKQKDHAASQKTAKANVQQLEAGMMSIRLNDSTNSVKVCHFLIPQQPTSQTLY
ncbi:uncharacterized protein ARMOST_16911 [Armillaria ostoyae]|uniref:Uncharacterized protein n=1 Tax=Armillaria ostoyae TaxID=47428 RepID=A0A284RXI3_ARMOS|nr:uncharacterized protein ARMOST_16911 [Armillaria ostoyae]